MKILVDENISHRLIALIDPPFEGSIHVNSFSPPLRTGNEIWKLAQEEDYVILTFVEDFSDWQLIRENPPKVIWLRMGNTPTKELARILKVNAVKINHFGSDPDSIILEIY